MHRAEILESRRHRTHEGMLFVLLAFLLLIFVEAFRPGWACRLAGCPTFLLGGNPFMILVVAAAGVLAVILAVVETQIDREGLREVLDDERRTIHRLKAWRNAYFGAVAGLFLFVILSGSRPTMDAPFLLGAVMVSGAVALYATIVLLDRD